MRTTSRWMKWVIEESDNLQVAMPWERGHRNPAWKSRLSVSVFRRLLARA
ncbi:MAG: hypothetical protein KDK00_05105 [Rhodobacteraceae bacterium]|nr:hypothetical protein [Paracoccaceae bacterium]